VSQTPIVNAMAVGFDKPFIVLNSGLLALLTPEEQRTIIAHEVGHIMSGHATYTTLALLLLSISARNLPFLAGIAILPFELALLEWYRKAEFSADRAGLLGSRSPTRRCTSSSSSPGGGGGDDTVSLEAFLRQAAEYETQGNVVDKVWQVINTAFKTTRSAPCARRAAAVDPERRVRPHRGRRLPAARRRGRPPARRRLRRGRGTTTGSRRATWPGSLNETLDRAREALQPGVPGGRGRVAAGRGRPADCGAAARPAPRPPTPPPVT
jgi:hypothetical protein